MTRSETYEWIFEPPRESLTVPFLSTLPRLPIWIVLFSSLFSYALAEAVMAAPAREGARAVSGVALLALNFILSNVSFFCMTGLTHRLLRLVSNADVSFTDWLKVSVIALVPVHITLPLALLCRPLGVTGLLVYSFSGIILWTALIRRWAWGAQNLCGWPLWAGMLLVVSPFLLACVGLFIFATFFMAVMAVVFLGLLL